MIRVIVMGWVVLGMTGILSAQDSLHVRVLANVSKDTIQLRWAVNSPIAWKQTNRDGFTIERITVVRNDQMLDQPERVVLTPAPIKPQPLANWEKLATRNNFAAIIAQALYGEDFELTGDDAKGVSKFIALAQQLEQRYMVSMYAADLCYPAALLAGWGYNDVTAKANERYLYRITPVTTPKSVKVASGSVYVSLKDDQPLPEPQELTAVFGDKAAMLTWNYGILSNVYNAYYLERSADGKNFKRISDVPLMNMNGKQEKSAERMFYTDSITNGSMVHYRLAGVNAFGEIGPFSAVVKGVGKSRLIYIPHITTAIPDPKGVVTIRWDFDQQGNTLINAFELHRSDNVKGPFTAVIKAIAPDKRSVQYKDLLPSNYFIIRAIAKNGEPTESFPILVQPADSIPPQIPAGLKGTIDTLGVVRLTWTPNEDADIYGYRVYRGQTAGEELIPLNDNAIRTHTFNDTIKVKNLNSKVYYAVAAIDRRYNQSEKSQVLEIVKPDLVPPSSPVIVNYKVLPSCISIEWVTGNEENLKSVQVYRQERGGQQVMFRLISTKSITQLCDSSAKAGVFYTYTLKSVTIGGLQSAPSPLVTIQASAQSGESGTVTAFKASFNRKKKLVELTWDHTYAKISQVEIYKAETGKPLSLWKVVKGFEKRVEDQAVTQGISYEYLMRPVLDGGKNGKSMSTRIK